MRPLRPIPHFPNAGRNSLERHTFVAVKDGIGRPNISWVNNVIQPIQWENNSHQVITWIRK